MIGNILNFNTIYQNIVTANTAGNSANVYFYIGRLAYLIVYFDPIVDSPLLHQTTSPVPDPVEILLRAPPRVQDTASVFSIIYDLPISFLNMSIGYSSPNSSVCNGNLSVLNSSVTVLVQQFNLKIYDQMGGTLKQMLMAVDPIAFACYYSLSEYAVIVLDYVYTLLNVN